MAYIQTLKNLLKIQISNSMKVVNKFCIIVKYGSANPLFDFTYNGLVNGDTATAIDTPPTAVTTATNISPFGTYEITCSGGSDDHYEITTCDLGNLTITPARPPPRC